MEKKLIVVDTNIIIQVFRNDQKIISVLTELGNQNCALTIITLAELYFGARDKKELKKIKDSLAGNKLLEMNKQSSFIFIHLMERFSLSHRLSIPDALIASICISLELELYTLNVKDFIFIPELKLFRHT